MATASFNHELMGAAYAVVESFGNDVTPIQVLGDLTFTPTL